MNKNASLIDIVNAYKTIDPSSISWRSPKDDDLDSPERIRRQLQEGVKRGQMWFAEDGTSEDSSLYVMIVDVDADDPRLATVIPLSNDLRAQTDDSLIIEKGSPLGIPTVAWPGSKALIPVRLLAKPLKEFAASTVESIVEDDPSLVASDDEIVRGVDQQENDSMFVQNREDIRMLLLIWHAMCSDLPVLHGQSELKYNVSEDLAKYNKALQSVLGLTPAQRIALSRGTFSLNEGQQKKMAEAGFPEQPKQVEVIDDAYLTEAEQPRWNTAAIVLEKYGDGTDPRLQLAHRAQFALAARTRGHGADAATEAMEKASELVIEELQR